MNAISLYVSASRLLFNQSDSENPNYADLYRLVPYLRQSLSCTVCANLLVEPYSPDVCQHHVCRNCIGGRKNLKPTCMACKNYQNYHANTQLRILLQCYKSLCSYILATPAVYSSMHKYVHVDAFTNGNNDIHNLAQLIDEGAQFHDEYKSNSGLPKSKISILPCIFTTNSSSVLTSQNQNVSGSTIVNKPTVHAPAPVVEAPIINTTVHQQPICITSVSSSTNPSETIAVMNSASLPKGVPIKTVRNGTALYSVLYTGSGNKITIKRKPDDNNLFSAASTLSTKDVLNILSRNPVKISQHQPLHQIQKTLSISPQVIHVQPQLTGIVTTTQSQDFKSPVILKPVQQQPIKTNKTIQKRKGCRCGNATPTPGKLTCCGQRCPCYVESKSCIDCKCRGCRNPHRIDGLKVRPQIPQLSCLVQMSKQPYGQNYIDVPSESMDTSMETNIKQEIIPISNIMPSCSSQIINRISTQMDHSGLNETIEYVPNDMDDDNIQVVNVYTTHMPEISTTLPTIIMQDEPTVLNNSAASADMSFNNHLTLPSDSYSLIGEELIKHSFSDESSSDEQSDVEIDL